MEKVFSHFITRARGAEESVSVFCVKGLSDNRPGEAEGGGLVDAII